MKSSHKNKFLSWYLFNLSCPTAPQYIARALHSSTSIGACVYVACGQNKYGWLNSVEKLYMGVSGGEEEQSAWHLIVILELTPRYLSVFSQISIDELCILGGTAGK